MLFIAGRWPQMSSEADASPIATRGECPNAVNTKIKATGQWDQYWLVEVLQTVWQFMFTERGGGDFIDSPNILRSVRLSAFDGCAP